MDLSLYKKIAAGFGLAVAGIGTVALAGWFLGWRTPASIRAEYIPMAPNTALLFLLLGAGLVSLERERRWSEWSARLTAALIIAVAFLRLIEYLTPVQLDVDRWIFRFPGEHLGLAPIGRMAFFTALNFMCAATALLALACSAGRTRQPWAAALAIITLLIGSVFALGYVYGSPLLYGGTTIPMALNTSVAFVLSGLGLLTMISGREAAEQQRAREALLEAHNASERQVRERTKELATANEALRAEIGERSLAEAALRETHDLLTAVIEASPMAITILDLDGNVRLWNPAAERIFGWREDEVLGRPLPAVPPDKREECRALRERTLRDDAFVGIEVIRQKKDGSLIDISLSTAPLRDDRGGICSAMTVMVDITERKRAEARLRLQATALEAAANGIVITDREGTIIWVNQAYARLTGYSAEEAIGQNPRILKSGKHDQAFYHNLWETILSGRVWQGETVNRRKDGSLYTEDQTITPVRDERGEISHFVAIKRDITEHGRLEEQLRQAQKLEAVGLLAGGVAHDFNNLLNGIIGFSELALRELPEGSPEQQHLRRVPGLGRQAASLIGQLLAFARKAPLERKPVDLNLVLKETGELLEQTFPETLTLQVEPSREPLIVNADVAQVQQIILNLATNARDAMPLGGTLTLRLAPTTLTEGSLGSHPERRPSAFARLTVADTGTGIPAAIRGEIFEPFFTTKEPGQGTGLGLASVHGIVHQHEGWIEVETAEGRGSAFHVFLPIVPFPAEATPSAAEAMPRGTETLLLVEDNPMVRELGEILLSDLGYTVLTAADGGEALAAFRATPGIALVLTDAIMPQMGAADLIPALRALSPDIKVLVATGYAPGEIRHTLEHLGVSGYIRKPFGQSDLATAVRAAIDGEASGRR